MKARSLALAASLVFGVAAVPVTIGTVQSCQEITVSGTVRYNSKYTWKVVDDAYHDASGIKSAQPLKDRLRIWLDFTATKVGSVQVTPDDKYASAGIRLGASAGLAYIDVFFYKGSSSKPIAPYKLNKAGSNVWVTGAFDQSCWLDGPTGEPTPTPTPSEPAEVPEPAPTDLPATETPTPTPEPTDG